MEKKAVRSAAVASTAEEISESVRYKVFVQKFPRLVEVVSPVVVKFAVHARSKNLISDYNRTQAENLHAHEYDRASILLSQILPKIKDSDAHFNDFVDIFQKLNFTKLASELKMAVNDDSTTRQDLLDATSKPESFATVTPTVEEISESVRYKAFIRKFPHLVEVVSPVVVKFAVHARSKDLISDYNKTQAENLHAHEYDRASILMSQILAKIKDSDAHFNDFVAILQELNFNKLASELKMAADPTESKNKQDMHKKFLDAVSKALQEKGTLEHTLIHGLFSGPAGSGKSSLMSRLLGEMPDAKSPSTGVANSVVKVKVKKLTSTAVNVKSSSSWMKLVYNEEAIGTINFTTHAAKLVKSLNSTSALPPDEELSKSLLAVSSSTNQMPDSLPHLAPPEGYVAPKSIFQNALDSEQFKELQHHFKSSWSLYLTDTGGQIEFQEVLPLLVSGASIFFLTFRLDRDLGERYTIEYRLPGGGRSKSYQSTLTVKKMILQTLASVASMKVATDSIPQLKKSEQVKPKVFIVGTHKDQLDEATRECKIDEIDRSLQDIIKPTTHYGDFLEFASESRLIFAVNNFSNDDLDFENIRSSVENIVERDEYKMAFPSHWLIFGLVIRQETIKDQIITYDECLAVAKDCGISDCTELDNALMFLYKTVGLVCHFQSSTLRDIVIRDPQVIFDHLTELIVQTFSFGKVGKQRSERFKQDGIFCSEELHQSMRSYKHMTAEKLVQLFEHLLIIASFKDDEEGKIKYFLPCALAHSEADKSQSPSVLTTTNKPAVPPLFVTFKCGYCPKGLAGALIVYLLTHKPRSKFEWQLQTEKIFRDQVSFLVSPWDIITLHIYSKHLILSHSREISKAPKPSCIQPVESICSRTREFVEEGISNVISTMKLSSDAHQSLSFYCQNEECIKRNGFHPASKILPNAADPCSLCCNRSGKKIISPLPDDSLSWFGTPVEFYSDIEVQTTIGSQLVIRKEEITSVGKGFLGKGSYGYVKKVKYKGEIYAAKYFQPTEDSEFQNIKKEADILSRLQQLKHPNIVRYIGGNTGTDIDEPFLVMELLETSLYAYLKINPELAISIILDLLHQVSKGLAYLHQCHVIHRDLTASNVLLTHDVDGRLVAKVADFGNSRVIELEVSSDIATMTDRPGTLFYCAPETFITPGIHKAKYNHKVDIYSFGHLATIVVIKQLNAGENLHNKAVVEIRKQFQYDLEKKLRDLPKLLALIKKCLNGDHHKRPSADFLQSELGEICKQEETSRFKLDTQGEEASMAAEDKSETAPGSEERRRQRKEIL